MEAEELYSRLSSHLATWPKDLGTHVGTAADRIWLASGYALMIEAGDVEGASHLNDALTKLIGPNPLIHPEVLLHNIENAFVRTMALLELRVPAGARGAFIPAGNSFDAFAAVGKILSAAKSDILIVDPYLDEIVLTEFGTLVPKGVPLRLLADEKAHKASLKPATVRWQTQHTSDRPLEVRLAPAKALHDRLVILDGAVPP